MQVTARRKTAESEIIVKVDFGPRYENPKKGLQTPMPFLTICWNISLLAGV